MPHNLLATILQLFIGKTGDKNRLSGLPPASDVTLRGRALSTDLKSFPIGERAGSVYRSQGNRA